MAADWIKFNKKIAAGPKIMRLLDLTELDVDTILGRMIRFWSWVDDNVTHNARLRVTDVKALERHFGIDERFWRALCDPYVAWLAEDAEGFFVPEWEKWFGKSAKQRQANAERQARHRVKRKRDSSRVTGHAEGNGNHATDKTRGEESRGDKNLRASTSPGSTSAAHKQIDVEEACRVARSVVEKLGLGAPLSPKDRSLVIKAAALSQRLGENWLWDAVEGVRQQAAAGKLKKPTCALLHAILAATCQNFNGQLKEITKQLPAKLLDPPKART